MVCWQKLIFLLLTAFEFASSQNTQNGQAKKVVCYYQYWTRTRTNMGRFLIEQADPNLCTHLIYASSGLDLTGNTITPFPPDTISQNGYSQLNGLKSRNPNLKTLLMVSGDFPKIASNQTRSSTFGKNAATFLRRNNFDGIDIGWLDVPEVDIANFVSLTREIRQAFEEESKSSGNARLLLSTVVPSNVMSARRYDLPALNMYLDFLCIYAYYYYANDGQYISHYAPLYSLQGETKNDRVASINVNNTVQFYLRNGVDSEKLIIGISTLSQTYTLSDENNNGIGSSATNWGKQGPYTKQPGYIAYYEICEAFTKNSTWRVVHINRDVTGPFAFLGNQWISYDDEESSRLKGRYARDRNLGGIMFWTIDNDDFRGSCNGRQYPIISAGKAGLQQNNSQEMLTNRTPSPSSSTPTTTIIITTEQQRESSIAPSRAIGSPCQPLGQLPDPSNCSQYFLCAHTDPSSSTGTILQVIPCPEGLLFSQEQGSCDYSQNVVCNVTSLMNVATLNIANTSPAPVGEGFSGYLTSTTPNIMTWTSSLVDQQKEKLKKIEQFCKNNTSITSPTSIESLQVQMKIYESMNILLKKLDTLIDIHMRFAPKGPPPAAATTSKAPVWTPPKPTIITAPTKPPTTSNEKPTTSVYWGPQSGEVDNDSNSSEDQDNVKSFLTIMKRLTSSKNDPCDCQNKYPKMNSSKRQSKNNIWHPHDNPTRVQKRRNSDSFSSNYNNNHRQSKNDFMMSLMDAVDNIHGVLSQEIRVSNLEEDDV